MNRGWTPSIVPNGHDQTVYLVINNYGKSGTAFAETDVGESDLETTINDLMSSQYNDPVRVVAFNTPNIGPRMHRKTSRAKLCPASISRDMRCRHRSKRSSTATSVLTVN
jgi:hypothetical protein